jgi:hypothetical protein
MLTDEEDPSIPYEWLEVARRELAAGKTVTPEEIDAWRRELRELTARLPNQHA